MEFETSTAITSSVSTGMAVALRSARRNVGAATPAASAKPITVPAATNEISELCAPMPASLWNPAHGATGVWPRIGHKRVLCRSARVGAQARAYERGHAKLRRERGLLPD